MPKVNFTKALKRFYPDIQNDLYFEGSTIHEVLNSVDRKYPGIKDYIVEENGQLRQHVNIFKGADPIDDRKSLQDKVQEMDEIYIIQALSGG